MKPIHPNNNPFRDFLQFWERYCTLEDYHAKWASSHMELMPVKRHQVLYDESLSHKDFFVVCRGMLANVDTAPGKRRILNIAIRNMSLATTSHLFSNSYAAGQIVALRSGYVLRVPYRYLLETLPQDPCIQTLVSVFNNKQQRLLQLVRRSCLSNSPRERFRQFSILLPEILAQTTQREQAELLGISRDTVQKTGKELLFATRQTK